MSESGDESAYMGRRTRALEDLVVRERTDDRRATTKGLSVTTWLLATPTHWAVDPLLPPSASWMRACEELYVCLDFGFAKQIIERSHLARGGNVPGSGLSKDHHGTSVTPARHPSYIIYDSPSPLLSSTDGSVPQLIFKYL